MDRRNFVKTGVAASVAVSLPATVMAEPPAKKQPNVLYVFSDQHRAASMPGEPFNEAHAPNIDAFRRANFSMDTCVSNYPLCTPYRGILMTGKYPHQSGLVRNALTMAPTEITLTKTFKDAGYHTSYVGKWHLYGGDHAPFIPAGPYRFDIDDWHIWGETNNHYHSATHNPDTGEKLYPAGWSPVSMTDQTIALLKERAAEPAKPWIVMLSFNPPHPPYDPPPADQAPYASTLPKRPNVKILPDGPKEVHTEEDLHKATQGYYGGITGVDLEFGRLLKTLDDLGLAENTVVIYTSDHGDMMGSQGRMEKMVPFEESCRVPFAVRHPKNTVQGSSKALFAAIDIYPTVCGLAGVAVPPHCQGHDMSALMHGHKIQEQDVVFLMNGAGDRPARKGPAKPAGEEGEGSGAPTYRGLRTATHTYAVTEQGRWLLYDNVADPYQTKNLLADATQKQLMDSFDVQIKAWTKKTGDPFPYPVV